MSTRRARPARGRATALSAAALALAAGLSGCSGFATGSASSSGPSGSSDPSGSPAPAASTPARLPDVTLTALSGGSELALRDVKGPAVVNVWASWCGPCREELPRYQAFAKAYAGKVDVVGIDFQDTRPQAARDLVRSTGVTYPSYRDPDGELLKIMRVRALPQVVLVDARGKVVLAQGMVIRSTAQLEDLVATHLGVRR